MLAPVIQSTPGRGRYVKLLQASLERMTHVVVDDSKTSVGGMRKAMQHILNTDRSHGLIMQDDIITCKNFIPTVEKIVEKYPNRLISYFSIKGYKGQGYSPIDKFCYAQAYSVPKKTARGLLTFSSTETRDDYLIDKYLNHIGDKAILVQPSLVEHLGWAETTTPDEKATLQTYDKRRMAGNFIGVTKEFKL